MRKREHSNEPFTFNSNIIDIFIYSYIYTYAQRWSDSAHINLSNIKYTLYCNSYACDSLSIYHVYSYIYMKIKWKKICLWISRCTWKMQPTLTSSTIMQMFLFFHVVWNRICRQFHIKHKISFVSSTKVKFDKSESMY